MRANDPVHWHPEPGADGFWAITRYSDVKVVGRDPATFSSSPTITIPDGEAFDLGDHQMMLMADRPRHTALRKVVASEFIPRVAKSMRPRIEMLASRIIDKVVDAGACDLVTDIAGLMPSYVIADILGIPHEDGVALYALTETIHAAPESQAAGAGLAAIVEMFDYASGVWEARRAEPADDLATLIAHASIDGNELEVLDFNLFFLLLIDAGGDTTRNLVAGGLDALFSHPEQLAWLTEDLDARLLPAVEELLRWVSPVVYMRRTAKCNTEVGGVPIATGQKVVMYYGSANRVSRRVRSHGRPVRSGSRSKRPRGLRRRRTPLLPGCPYRTGRDPCVAARAAIPTRRPEAHRTDRMACVDLYLRAQTPADQLSIDGGRDADESAGLKSGS